MVADADAPIANPPAGQVDKTKRKRKRPNKTAKPAAEGETAAVDEKDVASSSTAPKPSASALKKAKAAASLKKAELARAAAEQEAEEAEASSDEEETQTLLPPSAAAPVASSSSSSSAPAAELEPLPSTSASAMPPTTSSSDPSGMPADTSFASLNLSQQTMAALSEMGFTKMTEVQARTVPPLLEGRDVLGAARTGSGKTLAFLLPSIEMLQALRFKPRNGASVVAAPTRRPCHLTGAFQNLA
jgi:ATP-dependent RNA helicase DDX18/HAS1